MRLSLSIFFILLAFNCLQAQSLDDLERNTVDVSKAVQALAKSKTGAVIMISAYKSCAAFIKAMKFAGGLQQFWNVSFVGSKALANEWAATRTVDDVLSGRAAVAQQVADRLPPRIAPHRLGIVIQRVSVDHLAAPDEVKDSFDAVNQAQTGISTRVNQAEQDAQRRVSEANSLSQRLDSEAKAYANERETLARADADAFTKRLTSYRTLRQSNPDILAAIWREEVGKILAGVKERGRIEVLDDALGPNGLELNQFIPTKR